MSPFTTESLMGATKPPVCITCPAAILLLRLPLLLWQKTVTSRNTPSCVFSTVISFVNDRRSHFRFYSFSGRRGNLYTVAVILLFSSSLRQSNFTPVYRDYTEQRRCINSYSSATHGRNAWYVVLFKQASHSHIHLTARVLCTKILRQLAAGIIEPFNT